MMYLKNLLIVFVAMAIAAAFMAIPAIAGECYQQKMERLRQWEADLEKYNAALDQEYESLDNWSHTESERSRQISENLRCAKEEIRILKAEIADLEADNQRLGQQQYAAPDPPAGQFWPEPEVQVVPRYGGGYDRAYGWDGQAPAYLEPIPPPVVAVVPLYQEDANNIAVINQFDRDRREKRWNRSDSQFQHRSDFRREDRRDHAIRGDDSSTRRRDFSSQQVHPGNTSMRNDRARRDNLSPQQRSISAPTQPTQPTHRPHFGGGGTMPPDRPQAQMQTQPTAQPRMAPRPQPNVQPAFRPQNQARPPQHFQPPQNNARPSQPPAANMQNSGGSRGGRR